jgi:C1A family cysteine protease
MLLLLAVLFVASQGLVYEPRRGLSLFDQFEGYNQFWNKTHANQEEKLARFEAFKINAKKIQIDNAKTRARGSGATFGFTKFSDWTSDEFKKLLGFVPKKPLTIVPAPEGLRAQAPTKAIDWVAAGMTTAVKDQGQCGSCWAFSTTETVESANLMAGRPKTNGSPQEIVDCDSTDAGCNGGDPQEALQWVVQQGGLDTDACYPYQAQDGTCASSQCTPSPNLKISTVTPIASDEGQIYTALSTSAGNGPMSICCDAEPWQNYQGGVMTADQCGTSIDHAIQLTGYSPNQGGYWIVRNSWGASWGENGFIYLSFGENTCGITSEVTAAHV